MHIQKHMEAIFIVTLVIVSAGTFAFDSVWEADTWGSASMARDKDARHARTVVVCAPGAPQRA
jgi:hypothetical protein